MYKLLIALLLTVCVVPLHAKSDKKLTKYDIAIAQPIADCRAVVTNHAQNNIDVLEMFDTTVDLWKAHYVKKKGQFPIQSLLDAVTFAALKHHGQYRKNIAKTPYIMHPIGVAKMLWIEGHVRSINVLVAALLHDTLEDTSATPEEIEAQFGLRVRLTVEEVTGVKGLTMEENKQRQVDLVPQMTLNAQLVKMADRLYGLREMKDIDWPQETVDSYLAWYTKLLEAFCGIHSDLEKAFKAELELYQQP